MINSPAGTGYFEFLRSNRPFRYLWLGRLISNMGDWFNLIALFQAVQEITDSAQAVVLVVVVKTLPIFLMAPIAGPLVDRMERRRLLITMDGIRCVLAIGLIASYWQHSLVSLYACATLMVCATGISVPATNAALPMLVSLRQVPMANALLGGTWSVALAAGAALGGAATELFGVPAALVIDGLTFALSAMCMVQLPGLPAPLAHAPAKHLTEAENPSPENPSPENPSPENPSPENPSPENPSPESPSDGESEVESTGFIDGLRYLMRSPYILSVALLKSLMQLYGGLFALTPLYGTVVFADTSGPWYVGILFAVRGLGAAVGSLGLRVIFGDAVHILRSLIAVSFVLSGAAFAGLALCQTFWQAAWALFFASLGQSAIFVFSGSLLQMEADHRYHGRIFALDFGGMTLILAMSSYAYGLALDLGAHLHTMVLMGASLALVPIAVWGTVLVRRRNRELSR